MGKPMSRTGRYTMIAIVFALIGAVKISAQEVPPLCEPTPVGQQAVFYHGATSGCDQSNVKPCFTGETLTIRAGDQQITCPETSYTWAFPDGAVPPTWSVTHVFTSVGGYLVSVTISNSAGTGHYAATIPVAAASSVPALAWYFRLSLVLLVGTVALLRIH
jgi:hypothetical protein